MLDCRIGTTMSFRRGARLRFRQHHSPWAARWSRSCLEQPRQCRPRRARTPANGAACWQNGLAAIHGPPAGVRSISRRRRTKPGSPTISSFLLSAHGERCNRPSRGWELWALIGTMDQSRPKKAPHAIASQVVHAVWAWHRAIRSPGRPGPSPHNAPRRRGENGHREAVP